MATVIPSTGFRYYGKLYNTHHGAPAFQYIYDSGVVWQNDNGQLVTGGERPVTPDDLGSTTALSVSGLSLSVGSVSLTGYNPVTVVNTDPVPVTGAIQGGNTIPLNVTGIINTVVTGAVSASFDTSPIVNAQSTGNARILTDNLLLSGISGQLGGTLNVSVTNGVVPVSGIVTASVSVGDIAVTGFSSTIAPLAVSGIVTTSVSIGNVAVTGGQIQTITTGSISATVDNTAVILAIASGNNLLTIANQLNSGISGLLAGNLTDPAYVTGAVSVTNTAPMPVSGVTQANITNLILPISGSVIAQITGFNTGAVVTVISQSSSVATNYGPSGVVPFTGGIAYFGQALAANAARLECFVQNVHTGTPLYVNLGSTAASTGNFSMILNPSTVFNWGGSSFGSSRYKGAIQVSGGAWVAWEI
jgi:hypothetical protein